MTPLRFNVLILVILMGSSIWTLVFRSSGAKSAATLRSCQLQAPSHLFSLPPHLPRHTFTKQLGPGRANLGWQRTPLHGTAWLRSKRLLPRRVVHAADGLLSEGTRPLQSAAERSSIHKPGPLHAFEQRHRARRGFHHSVLTKHIK